MMCLPYIQMNMLALDLGLLSLVICLTPCCSCMDRPIKHTGRVAAFIYIYTWTLQNCDLTEHHFIESMIHALQIASITTHKAYNDICLADCFYHNLQGLQWYMSCRLLLSQLTRPTMIHALQIASITTYKAYNDTKRKLSKEYIQF